MTKSSTAWGEARGNRWKTRAAPRDVVQSAQIWFDDKQMIGRLFRNSRFPKRGLLDRDACAFISRLPH
jgi:hypothetical protein